MLRPVGIQSTQQEHFIYNNIHFTLCIKFTVTLIYVDVDE